MNTKYLCTNIGIGSVHPFHHRVILLHDTNELHTIFGMGVRVCIAFFETISNQRLNCFNFAKICILKVTEVKRGREREIDCHWKSASILKAIVLLDKIVATVLIRQQLNIDQPVGISWMNLDGILKSKLFFFSRNFPTKTPL